MSADLDLKRLTASCVKWTSFAHASKLVLHLGTTSVLAWLLTSEDFGLFGSAFLLTLSNPMVILSILALFAIIGIHNPGNYYRTAGLLVAGIFTGCAFLWIVLCYVISNLRGRLSERGLVLVNKVTGVVIFGCGAYAFISLIRLQMV